MVERLAVTLPVSGLPVEEQTDDPVLAAAWRALGHADRRRGQRGWAWVSASLSEPQLRALLAWLEGLPAAETVTERAGRQWAVERLQTAVAALD